MNGTLNGATQGIQWHGILHYRLSTIMKQMQSGYSQQGPAG
ncbi:hypothetical protein GGP86_003116 [Salinibacter ruber]|nr:hypothetical protein [Salinibacter ruber]